MESLPLTPYPSPTLVAAQGLLIPESLDLDSVQNEHTRFQALRRQDSYSTEIASSVSTIIDAIPTSIGTIDEAPEGIFKYDRSETIGKYLILLSYNQTVIW